MDLRVPTVVGLFSAILTYVAIHPEEQKPERLECLAQRFGGRFGASATMQRWVFQAVLCAQGLCDVTPAGAASGAPATMKGSADQTGSGETGRPRGRDESTGVPVGQSSDGQVRVVFGAEDLVVGGETVAKAAAWRMVEYFHWKGSWVHWAEGYLMYPTWRTRGATRPRRLFLRKRSEYSNYLKEEHGIVLKFEPERRRNPHRWRLVWSNMLTNITEADQHYREGEALFRRGDLPGALNELGEALAEYPNHLASHVLLVRCHESNAFETASDEGALRASWEYLRDWQMALEDVERLVEQADDAGLRVFFAQDVNKHPVLSQVVGRAEVLEKWLNTQAFTEEDGILADLGALLRAICSAPDGDARNQKITELCALSCVKDVLRQFEHKREVITHLFYSSSGEPSSTGRLKAMARRRFHSVDQFKAYLWQTLRNIERDLFQGAGKQAVDVPASVVRRAGRIAEIERRLGHELGRMPSEEELTEAIAEQTSWDDGEISDAMDYRRMSTVTSENMADARDAPDLDEDNGAAM